MRRTVLVIAVAACGSPAATAERPVENTARLGVEAPEVVVRYVTYGLMAAPRCGMNSYHIEVDADGAVRCGWTSDCTDRIFVSDFTSRLDSAARTRLADLARTPAFVGLKSRTNPHIIDGGVKELDVAGRTVKMVNDTAPAFEEFLALLVKETGCPEIGSRP